MPFASLSTGQRLTVLLELLGGPRYREQMLQSAAATQKLAASTMQAGRASAYMSRRTFLQNQLLFTGRRLLFYATLGTLGLAAAVTKLGFSYQSTIQQARVALQPVLGGEIEAVLHRLFRLAAFTPFTFQQITQAFRTMFMGMRSLNVSADFVTTTLSRIIDALSAVGQVTEGNIKRVSNAVQDLAYQGKLTGISVNQLARLGVPIRAALQKELRLTGAEMENIGQQGISAFDALKALNRYIGTTAGYRNAAIRQQSKTLYGAWTTFVDLLSQAAGSATTGPFSFLQRVLSSVNVQLGTMQSASITDLAEAFDRQLTPKTHLVINVFTILMGMIKQIKLQFEILSTILNIVATVFDNTIGLFLRFALRGGGSTRAVELLGRALGILLTLYAIQKVRLIAVALWTEINILRAYAATAATKAATAAQILWNFVMSVSARRIKTQLTLSILLTSSMWRLRKATWAAIVATRAFALSLTVGLIPALFVGAAATWAFTIALLANPITWIILAVVALTGALVLLYFRWKPFHDFVNNVASFIRDNWKWLGFLPIIGPILQLVGILNRLLGLFRKIREIIERPLKTSSWTDMLKQAYGILNPLSRIPVVGKAFKPWEWTQSSGSFRPFDLLGERGSKSAVSIPGGSRVFTQGQAQFAFGGGAPFNVEVHPQAIYFDGRKIGEVLSEVITDRKARL